MLLAFTGDLFLGSGAAPETFRELAQQLGRDVKLVVNFEGTLYENQEQLVPSRRKILLDSPVHQLSALEDLSISLLSTGNNHIADYGNDIARFTLQRLAENYPVFGAGLEHEAFHRIVHQTDECPIGFACYCTADTSPLFCTKTRIGPRPLNIKKAIEDLAWLKSHAQHCIAVIHWGEEDFHHPRPAHVHLGRRLIDVGFDIVIGHHSHTSQGYERYGNGWIFYSLGNFFFPDHSVEVDGRRCEVKWTPRRSWGLVPVFDMSRSGIELREVKILRCGRLNSPRFGETRRLRKKLMRICDDLSTSRYWNRYQNWTRWEGLAIRYEEFLNNEDKLRSIGRKIAGFLRSATPQ